MNHECGVEPVSPASAVPVLPPTLTPLIAAGWAYAVSTLSTIISLTVAAVWAETARPSVPPGLLRVVVALPGERISLATYGAGTEPPLAIVAATSAICNGVASSSPCPKLVCASSDWYHSLLPFNWPASTGRSNGTDFPIQNRPAYSSSRWADCGTELCHGNGAFSPSDSSSCFVPSCRPVSAKVRLQDQANAS